MLIITGARVSALKRIDLVIAKLNFKEHCVSKKKKNVRSLIKSWHFGKRGPQSLFTSSKLRQRTVGPF